MADKFEYYALVMLDCENEELEYIQQTTLTYYGMVENAKIELVEDQNFMQEFLKSQETYTALKEMNYYPGEQAVHFGDDRYCNTLNRMNLGLYYVKIKDF